MTRLRISLLAGIATIALGAFPAQALDLRAGPVDASVDIGGGANVDVDVGGGGGGGADANVNIGGDDDADVSANVGGGTQSTGGDVLDATVDLEDGIEVDVDILKLRRGGHAASVDLDLLTGEDDKVLDAAVDTGLADADAEVRLSHTDDATNLNADVNLNLLDTPVDAMVDLTIGGGGIVGTGVVDTDPLDGEITINVHPRGIDLLDLATLPPEDDEGDGDVPPTDGVPPDNGVVPPTDITDPDEIRDAFNLLSEQDVAALKVNCKSVLGNPSGFSGSAVAICKLALGM